MGGRPLAAGPLAPDRDLVPGVEIETDLGTWSVHETPGHAPSHVCLFQPERRLLISGDHLLGRVSLYFDYGCTPDPVGEFLDSLDGAEALDARLALSGHGRPFSDVHEHHEANRRLVRERLDAVLSRARRGARDGIRARAERLRRGAAARGRELAADQAALLPDPPRGDGRGAAGGRRSRALELGALASLGAGGNGGW